MDQPLKILALQFRYLGDAVMMVPALRALRDHFPGCALHLLVPAEAAPLFERLPWLARLWPMPRVRGRAAFRQSWPVVRALRAERFDRAVDFSRNDRGAILTWLSGARERLGTDLPGGFFGRRFCYTTRVPPAPPEQSEALRLLHLLSAWSILPPATLQGEIHTDPARDAVAATLLPEGGILCHLASSQPKKEWPVAHWAALHRLASAAGQEIIFSTGLSPREQALLDEIKRLAPGAPTLPVLSDLALFLAVIKRARAFVSGDTGPLHFAAGLAVPAVALFGPTSAVRWRPLGPAHQVLVGAPCSCGGDTAACRSHAHCLAAISPEQVWERLQLILNRQKDCIPRRTADNNAAEST